ncbi:MAG: hypothetical protein Q9180_009755, partial [Flavoplaca navasiana]
SLRDAKERSGTGLYPGSRPYHVKNGQMEANDRDTHKATSSASSPRSWRLLLSAPEELEDMDGPFASAHQLQACQGEALDCGKKDPEAPPPLSRRNVTRNTRYSWITRSTNMFSRWSQEILKWMN